MRELKNDVEQASSLSSVLVRVSPCQSVLKKVAIVAIFAICTVRSFAQTADEIRSIADKEANYVLSEMERLKGKAIMLPEVVAQLGVIRYAEATNNQKLINRVVKLYKDAYIEDGCLNRLTSGHIESQATAIIPLELYRITGDKSLLKDCWRVIQGQLRNPQKDGSYRHACASSKAQFIITMLQTVAHRVYGGSLGLKFASLNLDIYLKKEAEKGNQFFDNWKQWDSDAKLVGFTLADLEIELPLDHLMRKEYNDQYVPTITTHDQEGSLAEASIVEIGKLSDSDMQTLLDHYRKLTNANLIRLSGGKMKMDNMFPFVQLYSMAVGVRYGWLKNADYRKLLETKWAEFAEDYNTPELRSWNIIYKPLLCSGGRLLFATAMLNLDKKPEALKTQNIVKNIPLKRKFSQDEIDETIKIWHELRLAEANDDIVSIEKIKKAFKFDGNNPLNIFVELELYRLTGDYKNERECVSLLHDLLEKSLENKDLNSLLFAQGFNAYGTQTFANAAKIKLNESPLLKNIIKNLPSVSSVSSVRDSQEPRAEDIYKLGITSNDAASASANSAELRELCNKLQSKTGFFKHCEKSKGLCFSRVSGQAIYGIANFLKNLPKENANFAFFVRKIKDFAYAAERNQSQNGLWHTLPEDFNSPQDSLGSAFFVATLAIALEQKWIYRLEYRDILDLGWKGVQSKIENGKLTSVAPACEPRKISSAYALLAQVTGDALSERALNDATSAIKSYYASDIPSSEEDKMAVLGSMNEITAYAYEGKLPDGRILKHVSTKARFEIANEFTHTKGNNMKEQLMKKHPDVYSEYDFRLGSQILNKVQIRDLPDAIKNLRYPVGGITVWLKDNPSVHIVTDDLGYCILSMSYVPLEKGASSSKMMAQIPGFKPLSVSAALVCGSLPAENNLLINLAKEIDNTKYSKVSEGPSDKINGKLLAPIVLEHHRAERNELVAMLGKKVKERPIDNGVIIRPVYLRGKIISSVDGKPVDEVTVWLKRNPFMIHRTCEDGEFEILGKDAALYEHTTESLMFNAPGYRPKEIALNSYMNDNISVQMKPRNYKPVIQNDTTLPMLRIPSGFFRMGQGLWSKQALLYEDPISGRNKPDGRDVERRNCWPIQTVSIPSFYFSQYNCSANFRKEIYNWAMANGYSTITGNWISGFAYPIMLNAMSERDGFTPCYYTADLKIIRTDEDISENLICNWKADGYRLPTWAEWIYASRAGRTTGQFYGNDGDKYRDYYICKQASIKSEEYRSLYKGGFARRKALDWGAYGITLGQGAFELLNDFMFWRHNNSYHPRGPNLREARYIDKLHLNGRTSVGQFHMGLIDHHETQWFDKWPGNPIGFQCSGWGWHLNNGAFFGMNQTSVGILVGRIARSAENICNDINLVKTKNDINLKSPKPIKLNNITEKLDMLSIKGGEFSMGAAFRGHKYAKHSKFPIGSSRPEHNVTVSNFSASRFEITVQQWQTVQKWAKSNGYSDLPEGSLGKSSSEDLRHPVVGITWFDVLKWCNAVSEKENLKPCYSIDGNIFKTGIPNDENIVCNWNANGYRLPTEAEWEYAEQAGSDACWYWGDDIGFKYCWRGGHGRVGDNTGGTTHPVGQKYGNLFGLYDTIGNVWEWCWDIKTPHPMNLDTPINPKGVESKQALKDYLAGIGSKEKACIGDIKYYKGNRTLKGGAYNTQFGYHRYQCSQFRVGCSPEKSDDSIGFRVVRGE